MARMTRGDLKSLVKECLFEILLEATDDENAVNLTDAVTKRKSNKRKSTSRRPALDMVSMSPPSDKLPPKPNLDVSGLTSDPVMAAIFQDTASTTLVEQAAAERGKPSRAPVDAAAMKVSQSEPSELFGAASKNWATLAFDDQSENKSSLTTYLRLGQEDYNG